jgi:NAD+ diphosphatase
MLVRGAAGGAAPEPPSLSELGSLPATAVLPLGLLDGRRCVAVALGTGPAGAGGDPTTSWPAEAPGGLASAGLRELLARLEDGPLLQMVVRASELVEWYLAHAFCGRCGSPTVRSETEMARACTACGALHFPRINPAVITLVHRGREVLLARNHGFRAGFYALVAGFVEAGETLEQAVRREVREEVGVEVDELEYVGSQAWPFPSQLMVGFFARYAGGEIRVQESEISEARWFPLDRLPAPEDRPAPYSIAGRLIQRFLDRQRSG